MIKIQTEVTNITPEMAREILDTECFSDQRKKSSAHIGFLREVMQRGEFDGGESIRFAVFANTRFLINGQHRLEAIASGGGAQDIVVTTSYCDQTEEVAKLYSRIDRGRGRNINDVLRAIGMTTYNDLTQRQMFSVMACAPMFANDLRSVGKASIAGSSYASKSAEGRAAVMESWLEPAKRYFDVIGKPAFGNEGHFYRRDTVAVGIATFADLPASAMATEFWRGMATDDALASTDPRKQCLEFLKRRTARGRAGYGAGYAAHGVTVCWNAWMRGVPLKQVKVLDEKGPLRIAGTRFARRLDDGSLDTGTAPQPVASPAGVTQERRDSPWQPNA